MGEEVKALFPKKLCDYWWEKPKTWNIKHPAKCGYCPEPISKGEEYFEINAYDPEGEATKGHLYHLEYAEPIEWVPEEAKQ